MSDQDDTLEAVRPKSRIKLIILIAFILIFVLGVGGYGTYAYLQHKWPFAVESGPISSSQIASGAADAQNSTALDLSDQYITFDSAFTFNLPGKGNSSRMVQVSVVLVAHGANNAALIQQHLPLISATISEICSQQDFDSLASPSGRQRFKRLLLDGIRTKLTGVVNQPLVEQVLFTNFVMQ